SQGVTPGMTTRWPPAGLSLQELNRRVHVLRWGMGMPAFLSQIRSPAAIRGWVRTRGSPFSGDWSGERGPQRTELELEYTPTKFLQIEIGPTISYYNIRGVPGLNDRNAGVLNGVSATIRSLLIERGQSPFEVTLSVEPEWQNFDETSGETVSNCALETKIEADTELIKNRLFYAFNVLYEPEGTITGANPTAWDPESTFGVSSALAFQAIPILVIGADLWYLRHYEGTTLNSFTGDAVYLGRTFYWKISPKTLISASWEAQIA